ncbi:MAG: late competence development ComFB family protein [Spirochaetia bacterium]|nr:late competence development ComFB family protein [Spirochaetia bacterium]
MDIHNLMEELVKATVNELFDAEERGQAGSWCTCSQCRMDVACYVLNRLKPEYVVSGRGVAYSEMDYVEKLQRTADVVSLVREGWAQINSAKRPNHPHDRRLEPEALPAGPAFNVPPIMGRLFNGNNFEPIAQGTVSLKEDGALVTMMDANWQNPYPIVRNTAGTFIFWPRPATADATGAVRNFAFSIETAVEGYEPIVHYLELDVTAQASADASFSMQVVHKLPDLYVFPA